MILAQAAIHPISDITEFNVTHIRLIYIIRIVLEFIGYDRSRGRIYNAYLPRFAGWVHSYRYVMTRWVMWRFAKTTIAATSLSQV